MEFALSFEDGLFEFFRHFHFPGGIFLVHTGEDNRKLLGVALCNGADGAGIFGGGIFDEVELHFATLLVEGVACAHVLELDGSADVARAELVDLGLDLSAYAENLGQALAASACHIVEVDAGGKCARHHFEVLYLADMRLNSGFEHIDTERAIAVGFHLVPLAVDGSWHILYERHHVAQEFHHAAHAHILQGADAEHREYGTVNEPFADAFAHLVLREVALLEEFLHQSLVVFGSGLHQSLVQFLGALHLFGRNLLDYGDASLGAP